MRQLNIKTTTTKLDFFMKLAPKPRGQLWILIFNVLFISREIRNNRKKIDPESDKIMEAHSVQY